MAKGRLTLSIDEGIIKQIKILAINKDTSVTELVEKLIVEYLNNESEEKD